MKMEIKEISMGGKVLYLILMSHLVRFASCLPEGECFWSQNRFLARNMGRVCLTQGCVESASNIFDSIDPNVNPCDNFYKFACGRFIRDAIIPEEKSYTISFNTISDYLTTQLRNIVEDPPLPNEPRAFKLLKQFYRTCVNTPAIDKDNLKTAKSILEKLGGWPVVEGKKWDESQFHWTKAMHKLRENGFKHDSLINMFAGVDSKDSSKRLINVDQATLGLDREILLQGFKNKVVKAYYDYLVDIAVSFGADRDTALKEMKESVQFEIELANITYSNEERSDSSDLYHPTPIGQLGKKYPGIDWQEYVNNIVNVPNVRLGPNDIIDIGVPRFVTKLLKLLEKTPKRVQANYIISQAMRQAVPYLTTQLRKRKLAYEKITEGKLASEPRWKQCVEESSKKLKIAAGALYARTYFDEEARTDAEELVFNLKSQFADVLRRADWMDEHSKINALDKLQAMYAHVGYPAEFLDDAKIEEYYSKLEPSDNYLQFSLNIQKFDDDYSYSILPTPVNRADWLTHSDSTTVDAYYKIDENSIQLPAGILQGAFFNKDRPSFMNYGGMGFVIGHEMTHGFDNIGRQYDKNGNLKDWWTEKSKKAFLEKTQCMIDQYSSFYVPEVNMTLNGLNTEDENIADNGGAKIAYLAYGAWADCHGREAGMPALEQYSAKQMFWISLANLWCSRNRDEYLTQQILTDYHAPAYFRVMGSIQNSEYFARDFDCPLRSPMNPEHKCNVW